MVTFIEDSTYWPPQDPAENCKGEPNSCTTQDACAALGCLAISPGSENDPAVTPQPVLAEPQPESTT